ncbi:uncharacterized protein BCR38DRAFT_68116 [Pseudomassariella vexata]|uniref:Uncharacterized protein n=1 Tax=Pseudomassariella vexata TaxID=1141098 RepID=A0A1Y2DKP7_9PEZI|nr:uncharacterized protein BCR38DRAFT_68116 [Pseudomassariella vexata]ORY59325.1 hypothetical protein BCR38DRAFT_68116 [Pseudomassariella vexata]
MRWGGDIYQEFPHPLGVLEVEITHADGQLTALELAIKLGPSRMVEHMLVMDPISDHPNAPTVNCVRIACRRHKAELLKLLFGSGVDANIRDENGDTPLALLCQAVDQEAVVFAADGPEPDWPFSIIVARLSACVSTILSAGADPTIKNNSELSPLDHLRRHMNYDGDEQFRQELASCWNDRFDIDEFEIQERPTCGPLLDMHSSRHSPAAVYDDVRARPCPMPKLRDQMNLFN